jgi:hypothetical protein
MKSIVKLTMMSMLLYTGCDHDVPGNLPDIKPVSELPVFAKKENEIEIADSFKAMNPTMVLGAIVERRNGLVHSFDSFLKEDAKTESKPVSELLFKNFLENSVVADAEWLTFLKGQVNDSKRAEVIVTEVSNASIDIFSIDKDKLQTFAQSIAKGERDDYGVVIGYRDFTINASLFTEQGVEGNLSGYGAKIGGKWFGKHESASGEHRVVAIWSPLPFVLEKVTEGVKTTRDTSLTTLTRDALKEKKLRIRPLDGQRQFKLRTHR